MHAGGLLVPIEGTVSMLRDGAGQPTHFLFRADVRRTSGARRRAHDGAAAAGRV